MSTGTSLSYSDFLRYIAETLDIPDHLYEDATVKYQDIGSWLAEEDSELKKYDPEIYPQGSFKLGTMIRPITNNDEYDIDLVCHLKIKKESITQKDLKALVGSRLKKRNDIKDILEEKRRCWLLDYPQNFHMDVLPAIPNEHKLPNGILLTDTELVAWQKSNPLNYSEWFYGRMLKVFQERKAYLAESANMNVEDIPEWQVKTPLQRSIQLLKRHRDVYFSEKQDVKPVSIIITTLAGHSYSSQTDIYDAIVYILENMPSHIIKHNSRWYVLNPTDTEENFADKWNEDSKLVEAFWGWHQKATDDFNAIRTFTSIEEASERLKPILGSTTMALVNKRATSEQSTSYLPETVGLSVPSLGQFNHCQFPKWPLNINSYKAYIKGSVHIKKFFKKKLWPLSDRAVPKNVHLKFEVSTNAPKPYEVHWQIVNTGPEAEAKNDLRGDFYNSDGAGGIVRWEHTSYSGTHWVEAFIVKDGVCVARSNRKYIKVRG
jgi:hypothetical protein